jgi:DivIVA domain-containing protein
VRPEEIEGKEFLVSLRGYDKDEVRGFLREVAADYRKLAQGQGEAPNDDRPTPPPPASPTATGEVAEVMRAVVAEAAQIRAEAERDAERMRSAAEQANKGSRLQRVLRALGSP